MKLRETAKQFTDTLNRHKDTLTKTCSLPAFSISNRSVEAKIIFSSAAFEENVEVLLWACHRRRRCRLRRRRAKA